MEENGVPVNGAESNEVPLGLLKQASMKLVSAMEDIHEIREDGWTDAGTKEQLEVVAETVGNAVAYLTTLAMRGVDEETFLRTEIVMDEITEPEFEEAPELDPMDYPEEWE